MNKKVKKRKERAWDLFYYMSKDIAKDLKRFMKYNKMGYPSSFKGIDDWHNTIEKMWWSFNELANGEPNNPYNKKFNEYIDCLDSFVAPPRGVVDDYYQRVDDGLQLFATYFRDLWD